MRSRGDKVYSIFQLYFDIADSCFFNIGKPSSFEKVKADTFSFTDAPVAKAKVLLK